MSKELWEDEARDRFVTFLHDTARTNYTTAAEDVPVPGGKNFDYLLEPAEGNGTRFALELFRLTPERGELAQNRIWSKIVAELRRELLARGVKGYLIHTPHFQVTRPRRQQFVGQLAERLSQAISARPQADELQVDEYSIKRVPSLSGVEFMGGLSGGAFSSVAMAEDCLNENIEWKNGQLNVSGCTRVVVIVNWNPLVDSGSALLACSRFEFARFPNIDQVYFEVNPGNFQLVFDRSIRRRVEDGALTRENLQNTFCVSLIEARLVDRDRNAFNLVKVLTSEEGSIDWLSDDAHAHLIMLAQDLLKDDEIEDALWIIRHLRHSTEPPIRASLCWALHALVAKNRPEFYPEILDILERYAVDDDEDVRANVPIPLTELAARRRSKNADGTTFMPPEINQRVKRLAFEMLVNANGTIAHRLSWVFFYVRDVSEAEAWEIVSKLADRVDHQRDRVAALMIYYAVYRERQFPELSGFDSARFRQFLRQTLKQGRPDLRCTLVWSIWRGLREDIKLEDVLSYVSVIPQGEFERGTFGHLYRIVGDQLTPGRHDMCRLFVSALRREKEYLSIPENQIWHFQEFFDVVRKVGSCCGVETANEIREIILSMSEKLGVSREYLRQLFL